MLIYHGKGAVTMSILEKREERGLEKGLEKKGD